MTIDNSHLDLEELVRLSCQNTPAGLLAVDALHDLGLTFDDIFELQAEVK